MSERPLKVELQDIITPNMNVGETAIVFQRHGTYNRDRAAQNAGSIVPESAETIRRHDTEFFRDILKQEDVYVLFASSDTEYAGKGQRSMETGQVAQDAAIDVMLDAGIDPKERILNLNADFEIARHDEKDQDIRPLAGIREPQIFDPADRPYLQFLQEKYGYGEEDTQIGLSPRAWAMHEMDAEAAERHKTSAEGQEDLIARTDKTMRILERYAHVWHAHNPGKRLVIWTTSHYDTINPLVKRADGTLRNADGTLSDAYQPVDYGGGVVINIPADYISEKTLERRSGKLPIEFGKAATKNSITRLRSPRH